LVQKSPGSKPGRTTTNNNVPFRSKRRPHIVIFFYAPFRRLLKGPQPGNFLFASRPRAKAE
jgi:hypothetical protein